MSAEMAAAMADTHGIVQRACEWTEKRELLADLGNDIFAARLAGETSAVRGACVVLLSKKGLPTIQRAQFHLYLVKLNEGDEATAYKHLTEAEDALDELDRVCYAHNLQDPRMEQLRSQTEMFRSWFEDDVDSEDEIKLSELSRVLDAIPDSSEPGSTASARDSGSKVPALNPHSNLPNIPAPYPGYRAPSHSYSILKKSTQGLLAVPGNASSLGVQQDFALEAAGGGSASPPAGASPLPGGMIDRAAAAIAGDDSTRGVRHDYGLGTATSNETQAPQAETLGRASRSGIRSPFSGAYSGGGKAGYGTRGYGAQGGNGGAVGGGGGGAVGGARPGGGMLRAPSRAEQEAGNSLKRRQSKQEMRQDQIFGKKSWRM